MSDRETQIREIEQTLHDIDGSIRWPATAAALYDAGMRLGYRDFAAELRRRIDALPHANGEIEVPDVSDSGWVRTFSNHEIRCLRAALTAPGREFEIGTTWGSDPGPTAPERRWVVQRKSDGAFRDVPTAWTMSLEAATKMLSRIDALEVALLMPEICLIRAVVRRPGPRRWEECDRYDPAALPNVSIGGNWIKPIAPAPDGPWTLVEAP